MVELLDLLLKHQELTQWIEEEIIEIKTGKVVRYDWSKVKQLI
jgi:hypothetical protein